LYLPRYILILFVAFITQIAAVVLPPLLTTPPSTNFWARTYGISAATARYNSTFLLFIIEASGSKAGGPRWSRKVV
jgi:hypothetical protein